jgi:putative transposase
MPKGRRVSPEDAIRWMHEVDALCNAGRTRAEACREAGLSQKTYYGWRSKYAGRTVDEAVKVALINRENAQLKRLVAEMALKMRAMEDVIRGKP